MRVRRQRRERRTATSADERRAIFANMMDVRAHAIRARALRCCVEVVHNTTTAINNNVRVCGAAIDLVGLVLGERSAHLGSKLLRTVLLCEKFAAYCIGYCTTAHAHRPQKPRVTGAQFRVRCLYRVGQIHL